jgi:hypothetical protein
MSSPTATKQALDCTVLSPHTEFTCGQSRGGGVRTSNSRRRSRFLGRVAVAHVQGSPKGGGALGLLRVLNTRLRPVPSPNEEAPLRKLQFSIFFQRSLARPCGRI